MPRNQISINELKVFVEKLKLEIIDDTNVSPSKPYANKYLNKVLDKINEYRY